MPFSPFFRQLFSLGFIVAIIISQVSCTRGKALVKRYINGEASYDLASSFDASVPIPAAPNSAATLDIPITIERKPITAGVPIAENANVRDANRIALVDANNKPVPAQFRVLSRWRGLANDLGRPIKWLLIDTDAPAGEYRLVIGDNVAPATKVSLGQASVQAFAATGRDPRLSQQPITSGNIAVQAGRVQLTAAAQGNNLLTSFILDGTERLTQPVTLTIHQPRTTLVVGEAPANGAVVKVTDPGALAVGAKIRFEHLGELPFESLAGTTSVTARERDQMYESNRQYRIEEGTPRQEDIFVTKRDDRGWIFTQSPLRFTHPPHSRIRDLGSEEDTAIIKTIREKDQVVTLDRPLRYKHNTNEKVIADAPALVLSATVDEAKIEEAGPLRMVIRQDGHFQSSDRNANAAAMLRFTLRYHIYATQGFVRTQLRIINTGPFGFGGDRNSMPPYAQHALLQSLQMNLPFAGGKVQRVEARNEDGAKIGSITAGKGVEIAAPEFAENFPKALSSDATSARFEILPRGLGENNGDFVFEGARAKTTDFYFGLDTKNAVAITNSLGIAIDPEYIAATQAVRPVMVAKQNWTKAFPEDRMLGTAAMRMERWLSGAYANESNEGTSARPAQSIFEVRRMSREGSSEKNNGHFGWQNFGDFVWADGYTNLHYDINFIMLREFLRTGDKRAFQLGSELSRFRADWGEHHAVDYWDSSHTYNLFGFAFYEKGDHGTYTLPKPSHHWVEGLWLYWALTGDESVHQSAQEGTDVLLKHPMDNYLFGLNWNESRWYGWPALDLMVGWRYAGDVRYFELAKKLVYLMMQAEENAGRKGYFIPSGSGIGPKIQPFMWGGYSQLGAIEYWRETNDKRVADFLVRIADWLIGNKGERPVLMGGKMLANGNYEPVGAPFFWAPGALPDARSTELAIMNLPVLTFAARVTGRSDLQDKARLIFRDVTYFRDAEDNAAISPSALSQLNFRSPQFAGSYIKVYGHFGLFAPDYLADIVTHKTAQPGMK